MPYVRTSDRSTPSCIITIQSTPVWSTTTWCTAISVIKSCVSSIERDLPLRRRVFLVLRFLLSSLFRFRNSRFSASSKTSLCIVPMAVFFNFSIALWFLFGELPKWLEKRFFRKFDWEDVSMGLLGVFETQEWDETGREFGGVGVFNYRSRFEMTLSGSNGRNPAPRKPPWMLLSDNDSGKAAQKAGRKSSLVMWVRPPFINSSICLPYVFFNGLKHPISKGWRIWNEWTGIQRVIMLFSLQYISKLTEW